MIVLHDNGLNLIDEVSFGIQKPDTTTGRFPNGTGEFTEMLPTFGMENSNILTILDDGTIANFELLQNFPNPFNDYTNIVFNLEENSNVELEIYNIYGHRISSLFSGILVAGEHSFVWNVENNPGGIYLYTLTANGNVQTNKMIVR